MKFGFGDAIPDTGDLLLFRHLLARPDQEIDLALTAVVMAAPATTDPDPAAAMAALDELGRQAKAHLEAAPVDRPPVVTVVRMLFEELEFRGQPGATDDARVCFLGDVLTLRFGIPVTLGVILAEVCQRAGVPAEGITFPGRYLVRVGGRGRVRAEEPTATTGRPTFPPMIIDPLDGKLLTPIELRKLYERHSGRTGPPPPPLLEAASKRKIVARILHNLRDVYERLDDQVNLRVVEARLDLLGSPPAPEPEGGRMREGRGAGSTRPN